MKTATLTNAGQPINNAPTAYHIIKELGIDPGETYTKHLEVFNTYTQINNLYDEGQATTEKLLNLIRTGDKQKVLNGLSEPENIKEISLGLLWTTTRRENIVDKLNRDFTAESDKIANELTHNLNKWYQKNVTVKVESALKHLPETLDDLPAIMASGHQAVDAYNSYQEAKRKHEELQKVATYLRNIIYTAVDKEQGIWKIAFWAQLQHQGQYIAITQAADPLWAAAQQGVTLSINHPDNINDYVENVGKLPAPKPPQRQAFPEGLVPSSSTISF